MPFLLAYWRQLAGVLVLVALAAIVKLHFVGDDHLRSELKQAQADLLAKSEELRVTQENFRKATEDAKVLSDQAAQANADRERIRSDLQQTLNRLKNTPAPKECPAQVEWLYEQAR